MKLHLLVFVTLTFLSGTVIANKDQAILYLNSGQFEKAMQEFSLLAKNGDHVAMVALGNMHYRGKGTAQDYDKALDWWMKAYELGNPDAIANIGVLYRDGKGVEQNLMIAYDIFLLIQLKNIGGPETQFRNNSNIIKTVSRMNQHQIQEALCYSEEYIFRYLANRGEGTLVQYREETSLKSMLKHSPALQIPQYDCELYRS